MIRKHLNAAQIRQLEAAHKALRKIDAEVVPIINAQERLCNIPQPSGAANDRQIGYVFRTSIEEARATLIALLADDD